MNELLTLDFWFEWGGIGLSSAMYAGFTAGLLALVILPVNLLLRRWLTAGQLGLLWGVVLLRLALPIAPASPFSLERVFEILTAEPPSPPPPLVPYSADPIPPGTEPAPTDLANAAPASSSGVDWNEVVGTILVFTWLAGVPIGLAVMFARHWRFTNMLRKSRLGVVVHDEGRGSNDPRLVSLWNECRLLAEVGPAIPIQVTHSVLHPALHGLWRPRLLLPETATELSDDQLRMVMLHELAHVRRWDIAANWGLALLRIVHWWNPVFWLAASRFAALREQACDAFSLSRFAVRGGGERGASPSLAYGELLLAFAELDQRRRRWSLALPASLLGFALWSRLRGRLRQWSLARRLRALPRAGGSTGLWQKTVFAAGFLAAAACGLTSASSTQPAEEPFDWSPLLAEGNVRWAGNADERNENPGPKLMRVYDVGEIVRRWAPDFGGEKPARAELELRIRGLLGNRTPIEKRAEEPRSADSPATVVANPPESPSEPENDVEKLKRSYTLAGDQLILSATAGTHAKIASLLAASRSNRPNQISIECRIISCPVDLANASGIRWTTVSTGARNEGSLDEAGESGNRVSATTSITEDLPVAVGEITDALTGTLVRAALRSPRSNLMLAPKITLLPTVEGFVFSGVERPFVVGISREADKVVPQIAICPEGIHLTMRAGGKTDPGRVRLQCNLRMTQTVSVRTFQTRLEGTETTVQIPSVRTFRVNVDREIEEGHSLLIGCPPTRTGDDPVHVVLTPRVLPLEVSAAP